MQSKLTLSALLGLALSSVASAQQSAVPTVPTGSDQLSFNCAQLIPLKIDDELPEGVPGGDTFDQGNTPGGGQFDPLAVPGGDTFVQTCFDSFRELDLLIPGGDTFDPKALARVASGELEVGELPDWIPGGDTFSLQDVANDVGLGVPGSEGIIGIDGFTPERDPLSIPGGDTFDPPTNGQSAANPSPDHQPVESAAILDECNWTGTWSSSYGDLRLIQKGQTVNGDYANNGTIEGTLGADCALDGSFDNVRQSSSGTIAFTLDGDRFNGVWGYDGQAQTSKWGGTRRSNAQPELVNRNMSESACVWTGTWSSSIGDLKLVQNGNQVSGQHRTKGQVSGTVDDCRLRGTIESPSDETARDFSIAKGARRFDGTWSWQDSSNFRTNVWGGTLRSAEVPTISQPATPERQDPAPAQDPVPEPAEDEPEKEMTRTWRVTLHSVCAKNTVDDEAIGISIHGIGWIKARVTHKQTGEEITIAPIGGFPSLNNDKERVFDVRKHVHEGDAYLSASWCSTFSDIGFVDGHYESAKEPKPIALDFEIDAEKFGYDDVDDLLSNRNNRLRVMVKLGAEKLLGFDPDFGIVAKSTPFSEADFCGSCKLKKSEIEYSNERVYHQRFMRGTPTGSGVLSGFKDGEDEAAVFYDIKPLE